MSPLLYAVSHTTNGPTTCNIQMLCEAHPKDDIHESSTVM